jgi:hypothetical protein
VNEYAGEEAKKRRQMLLTSIRDLKGEIKGSSRYSVGN